MSGKREKGFKDEYELSSLRSERPALTHKSETGGSPALERWLGLFPIILEVGLTRLRGLWHRGQAHLEREVMVVPNTKSAKKRVRQAEKRRTRNKSIRSYTKTMVKRVIAGVDEGIPREELDARIKTAVKAIDKAVSKGVYHKNEGARRKSRLMAYVNRHYKSKEEAA